MAPGAVVETNGVDGVGVVDGINKPHVNGVAKTAKSDFDYPAMATPYRVLNQYHSKPTKLRVACVGAGASGMCLSYKMVTSKIHTYTHTTSHGLTRDASNRTRCSSPAAGS